MEISNAWTEVALAALNVAQTVLLAYLSSNAQFARRQMEVDAERR